MNRLSTACIAFIFTLSGLSAAAAEVVNYSYSGPTFTTTSSEDPALYEGRSINGSFTMEKLLPSTTTDLKGSNTAFNFSDGVRSISNANIVPGPGDVTNGTEFYVQSFTMTTDGAGNISSWFVSLISSSQTNALGTFENGTGGDSTRITVGLSGCVQGSSAAMDCRGSVPTGGNNPSGTWTISGVVQLELCDNDIDDDGDGLVDLDDPDCTPGDYDGDGFPDEWELGLPFMDGNGDLVVLDIAALGADPCRKTIAVEIDYMDGSITGNSHEPHPDLIPTVAATFSAAPIPAVGGCPFEGFPSAPSGFNFIAYVDEEVSEQDGVFRPGDAAVFRDEQLLPWFHHVMYAHALKTDGTTSGLCCDNGSFIVSLGNWTLADVTPGADRTVFFDPDGDQEERLRIEAGTFMHELGHTLGLPHGGSDKTNFKPNYLSVMNYQFQTSSLTNADDPATPILDYSRQALPILDERELDEAQPLCDPLDLELECQNLMTAWRNPSGVLISGAITDQLDWNDNGDIDPATVAVDINGDDTGECVGDGSDDVMDTALEGDDIFSLPYITSGPDQICDTTKKADSDDSQLSEPGELPNVVYEGHEDWPAIKFRAAENAYGAGTPLLGHIDHEDITAEEAYEIDAFWDQVRKELLAGGVNQPPTADAGPDQLNVEATSATGAPVDLDGSASNDLDLPGDSLTFEWTGAFAGSPASGETPSVQIPLGLTTVTLKVTDAAGASDTDTVDILVVDTTAPTVTPPDDVSVLATGLLTAVNLNGPGAALDLVDGNVTPVTPDNVGPFPPGLTVVTWSATDSAIPPNTGTATQNVTVSFNFVGFLQPIENLPMINSAKAGQTVPVKWQMPDGQGGFIRDVGIVSSLRFVQVNCDTDENTFVNEIVEDAETSGNSGLVYDATDEQYIYRWKTNKGMANNCYLFLLDLDDGTQHQTRFDLRK